MKTIINITFFTVLIFFSINIKAQSHLYLDAAQVFSTFKFSSENQDKAPGSGYSTISTTAFGIGYEYLDSSGLMAIAGLGVRKAGSSLVLNKVNYTWNLQYLDLKAGIGYQYNKLRLRPYVAVSPFYSQLLSAKQTIGLTYYDIKTSNTIKTSDFGLFLTAGFSVPVSKYISIYLDYSYILGLRNLETTENQYLYNRGSAFKLGLLFNISASKVKEIPVTPINSADSLAILQKKIDFLIAEKEKEKDTKLSDTKSIDTKPADTKNTDTKPTDTKPVDTKNTDTPPTDTKPADTKNTDTQPTDNKPVDTKNTDSKPIDTKPADTKNTDTKPIDTAPADTKNTDTKAVETNLNQPIKSTKSDSLKINLEKKKDKALNNASDTVSTSKSSVLPDTLIHKHEQNEKLNEKQLQDISKIADNQNIIFKIQLVAVKNELKPNNSLLKNVLINVKKEKGADGWFRYYTGSFKTYEKALTELNKIKSNGVNTDAFIVAFKDGKKITVADAKNILK